MSLQQLLHDLVDLASGARGVADGEQAKLHKVVDDLDFGPAAPAAAAEEAPASAPEPAVSEAPEAAEAPADSEPEASAPAEGDPAPFGSETAPEASDG